MSPSIFIVSFNQLLHASFSMTIIVYGQHDWLLHINNCVYLHFQISPVMLVTRSETNCKSNMQQNISSGEDQETIGTIKHLLMYYKPLKQYLTRPDLSALHNFLSSWKLLLKDSQAIQTSVCIFWYVSIWVSTILRILTLPLALL